MTFDSFLCDLFVGALASVLTIAGNWRLQIYRIKRRLRGLAGEYEVIGSEDIQRKPHEIISIKHQEGNLFVIHSTGGENGGWTGEFVVDTGFLKTARGRYRHLKNGNWGIHEMLFSSGDQIRFYGTYCGGDFSGKTFSYTIRRRPAAAELAVL